MPISLLRLVGIALAIGFVWLAVVRLRRRGSGSRVPAIGLLLVGLGLGAIAIVPDLVRPIQGWLGLEGEPLGRLVTVLVVSVAIAYMLLFYTLSRADRANQRVSRLVRALSAAQVEAAKVGAGWGGVLVCIPAYNEAESLPAVLAEVPSEVAGLKTHILVIDDGSRDGTALVATRLGVDVVVTLDADGQHDPGQMARLVEPIVADTADFVVGSRRMGEAEGGGDSRTRDAGITVYTRLINLLGGTEVSDIANGYRAIRASRLAEIAFTEDQFHNPELLLGAARAGLRVVDVPVTIRRRSAGVTKKGTNVRYGLGFLRVMIKTWLR